MPPRRFSRPSSCIRLAVFISTPSRMLPMHDCRATLLSVNGLGAFIMIIVAAVLLALLGLALVRRTVPHDRLARHIDVAGYVYAVIGVIYAVILAQVVIAAWQEYQDARAVADDDANAVLNLARLPQVWPDEDRERVEVAFSIHAQHGGRRMAGHGPESGRRVIAHVAHPRSLASGQRSRS